jgi:lipoprotein-releasing system permease protein
MPYETTIGWRFLYSKGGRHRRLLISFLLAFIGATVLLGVLFLQSGQPPPALVVALALAATGTIALTVVFSLSVFTAVSVFGVILGVAALTIVMAVTSGFQQAFQDKVLGVNAHVIVMRNDFVNYRDVQKIAAAHPHVTDAQPFVFVEMLITRGRGELSGIAMKGVDPDGAVLDLPKHMEQGSIDVLKHAPGQIDPTIIIGRELATKLKAKVGDQVTLVLPNLSGDWRTWSARAGSAKTRKFRVGGIFYSGFDEYDRRLVYIGIEEAQDFVGSGDIVTGIEMRVDDVGLATQVARDLEKKLDKPYSVIDWKGLNRNLFTALTIQKIALLVSLSVIIIVAAFNMVAALSMMVINKVKEIAILKSMGASSVGVAGIFQVVGMTIGGIGTALGLGLGLLFCHMMSRYGYHLDPKVYLIDRLPISVDPVEVALVGVITLAICFFATLFPALKASAMSPVEGLRYE